MSKSKASSWNSPNYINPVHRGSTIAGINISLTILAFAAVLLRMYTRGRLLKSVGADDWMISLGVILASFLAAWNCAGIAWGMGRHVWDIPREWWEGVRKIIWGTQVLYIPVLGIVKLSILLALLRVTPTAFNQQIIYFAMGIVVCLTLSTTTAMIFQCTPIRKVYHVTPTAAIKGEWIGLEVSHGLPGTCIDRLSFFYTTAWLNIFTDFAILLIPIPMLLHLRLPSKQKFVLIGVFSLGGIVCIASIARLAAIQAVLTSDDPTWEISSLSVWSCVEVSLGIICACIPTLKPIIARYLPHQYESPPVPMSDRNGFPSPNPVAGHRPRDGFMGMYRGPPLSTLGYDTTYSQDPSSPAVHRQPSDLEAGMGGAQQVPKLLIHPARTLTSETIYEEGPENAHPHHPLAHEFTFAPAAPLRSATSQSAISNTKLSHDTTSTTMKSWRSLPSLPSFPSSLLRGSPTTFSSLSSQEDQHQNDNDEDSSLPFPPSSPFPSTKTPSSTLSHPIPETQAQTHPQLPLPNTKPTNHQRYSLPRLSTSTIFSVSPKPSNPSSPSRSSPFSHTPKASNSNNNSTTSTPISPFLKWGKDRISQLNLKSPLSMGTLSGKGEEGFELLGEEEVGNGSDGVGDGSDSESDRDKNGDGGRQMDLRDASMEIETYMDMEMEGKGKGMKDSHGGNT